MPEATQQRSGQVIGGKYKLLSPLGEGAFGEVWLAQQLAAGATVVIKLLHPQWARVPEVVQRFRREALATTRVSHENVCRIFEYAVTDDETPFIAMEYLSGGTLKQALAREGAMCVGRVAQLMAPVCEAVAAAHQVGIVHRDLKPDNIMLTERDGGEHPIVLDFGIAKLLGSTEKLTQTGSMMGTPAYMSPEQCQGKSDIGPPADVYALAIIAYELLVGAPPFTSRTLAEMAMKHVLEPPPKLANVPSGLADMVGRCLSKEATDRPPPQLLAAMLREAADQMPHGRATTIEVSDDQKLNPASAAPSTPKAAARPGTPATGSRPGSVEWHQAATVISTGGAELEARTRELLAKAKPQTGPAATVRPRTTRNAVVKPPTRDKAGVHPAFIAIIIVALGAIGVLIGLLLRS